MGQCLKISEGTFSLKMTDSNAILGSTPSIFVLDQFSQCRKMRLEQAHLMHPWNKLYEPFWKIHYFKDEQFVEFEIRLTLNYCISKKNIPWVH